MKTNVMIAMASVVMLSGCMATGATYNSKGVPNIQSDKAQLVIYRPMAWTLGAVPGELEINGMDKCSITSGGYMVENVTPGETVVAVDTWQLPGTSKLIFNAVAGKRYYLKVAPNNNKAMLRVLGGVIASETMSDQSGPFLVYSVDKGAATKELSETKQSGCN